MDYGGPSAIVANLVANLRTFPENCHQGKLTLERPSKFQIAGAGVPAAPILDVYQFGLPSPNGKPANCGIPIIETQLRRPSDEIPAGKQNTARRCRLTLSRSDHYAQRGNGCPPTFSLRLVPIHV